MRSVLLLGLMTGALWGQVTLDCNLPANITISPATPRANLKFNGGAGEAIFIRVVGITTDPTFFLAAPKIVDQFGNVGASLRPRTGTGPNVTPIDLSQQGFEFDLFTDSLFTLQLQSGNPTASGTLRIILARINRPCPTSPTLTCGHSIAGTISPPTVSSNNTLLPPASPGQIDTYTYNVQAGDKVSFRLLRVAASGAIFGNGGFPFVVYGPDGHAINVVQPPDPNAGRLSFTQMTNLGLRSDLTLAVGGTLTIIVFEQTGALGGNYYISATKLNGGCGGPAVTCGGFQDGQLTTPLTFGSYTINPAQGEAWQFRVARSDTSGSFAPTVQLYDGQGNLVSTIGPVSASGHAVASSVVKFPATGSYFVMVSGPPDGSTGGFTLSTVNLTRPCAEQTLGCSSIVDGSISGLLRNHVYSLQASAGDNFLLRLLQNDPTALFRPRMDIYDATGGQLQFINAGDQGRSFTAPADGTYSVLLTDSYDSSQSGSYAFSLLRLNRPCNAGTLTCGVPSPGNLARSLSSGVYTWTAAAAESFSVRMLPTGGVQPAIQIYDGHGNLTGQALTGAVTATDVVAPAAGAYTIVALDNSQTPGTGSFTLDVLRTTNACAQPLPQGQTVTGVVSAAAPFMGYTFTASAGDLLALRSASSTPGFSAQMEIYDPTGSRLDGSVFGLSRKAAASGVYTVIVGASAPRTAGGYAFAWQLLNNPVSTAPLACGTTASGSLAGATQFRYYTVAADAGDTMRMIFTKTSDNFAPQVELFDPTGSRLAANSDVNTKATAGGNYLVLVSPSTAAMETGSYALAYQRPNNACLPAALTCGQTTLRQVNLPGQLDTLTFNGTGGDLTTIRLASRSGNYSPFVEMYNAKGTQLSTSSNGQLRSVLAADGQYTLLVRDRGAINLGSYRVSLQDDTNNCPVTDTEPPVITLLKPTGGEVLPGGATYHIQWLSDDNVGVATHDIALSMDGGKTFPTAVAGGLSGNQQVYDWPVPPDITPTRTAVLRVTATDAAGNAQSAMSDLLTVIGSGFTPNASAQYTYDALNRLTQATLGDGRTIQYTWDATGNLVQITVTGQ